MSSAPLPAGFSFVERLAQDLRDERLELPSFPEAVLRVQRALQAPDSTTEEIVRILSSEPALAARLLRIANSAEFRRMDGEITDLRKAVSRMGFNMVRSVSVAFAMRQLRRKDTYTPKGQAELEAVWKESIEIAAASFVLAKRLTKVNPDQALLTGLLSVLGRLYILMRAQDLAAAKDTDLTDIVAGWHATIGKAILESWGLPAALQQAVEHQDDFEAELEAPVGLTETLIAAKLLTRNEKDPNHYPVLKRLIKLAGDDALTVLEQHAQEFASVKSSLSD